jgi:hypothetical protein
MQVGAGARATTDDLGRFRLYGLPAGEFYVSANYTVPTLGPDPAQAAEQPRYGFAPTFYPSAAAIEGARRVRVSVGQETGGIDLTLVRAKPGPVSGRVTDAAAFIEDIDRRRIRDGDQPAASGSGAGSTFHTRAQ